MATRRKGKIAGLPYEIRGKVNVMLRNGSTYGRVSQWLESSGFGGVTEKNVEAWCKPGDDGTSGYLDWIKEQERLEDITRKREFALEIVKANDGATIHEAAMQVAAAQMYEVVTEFDLAGLKAKLHDNPEIYGDVVNAMTKLGKNGLAFARYREQVAERKAAIAATLDAAKTKGGVTTQTLEQIERELRLM